MTAGENCIKNLFAPCATGHPSLKNRFVRSATAEPAATPDGVLTEAVFPVYEALAAGGVGRIITGHMYCAKCFRPNGLRCAHASATGSRWR